MSKLPTARLLSVQVGSPMRYHWLGRDLTSSINKVPVTGPVKVLANGLEGDEQADPQHHGGPDKAAYAYAAEDYARWSRTLGRRVGPASFGDNITTEGLDLRTMVIGTCWQVGSAVLEVSEPRTPCWKLGMAMGDAKFPRAFSAARRPGVLLRVIQPGILRAGDLIEIGAPPAHGITALDVINMYYGEKARAAEILAVPQLAAHWQKWADHRKIWHLEEERERGAS